jgi:DUF438 domain-containing protein
MKISLTTKVHDLLKQHPFLEDFLAEYNSKFEMLKNPAARATLGRVATLNTAAGIAGIEPRQLMAAIADEIEKQTGLRPESYDSGEAASPDHTQRVSMLKEIISDLHDGGDLESARQRFNEAVGDVDTSEIAAMEEELIRGGLPVSEVQRLCDVHVGAFRDALDQHEEVKVPLGHPVHTYMEANKRITELANRLGELAGAPIEDDLPQAARVVEQLGGIENHYQRKENQLFAVLERHGVTGPSQVMWGVHDEIRSRLKTVRQAVSSGDLETFAAEGPALARDLVEMVYKEEKVLFPLLLQTLSEEEWVEIRRGEEELGYVLAKPAADWPLGAAVDSRAEESGNGLLEMLTGRLNLEQVNLIFTHLPVDLSFVDETDTVLFYSEGPERIFPRTPAVIGRKVQNCHPPKSVHMVQAILDEFRAGTQNTAEFWIEIQGKFIHIRYFAVRDDAGAYRGCLEVSQDVTGIRALEGERRLLEWQSS